MLEANRSNLEICIFLPFLCEKIWQVFAAMAGLVHRLGEYGESNPKEIQRSLTLLTISDASNEF